MFQRDASFIKVNDKTQLTFDTSETIEATVNFVQTLLKSGESFC